MNLTSHIRVLKKLTYQSLRKSRLRVTPKRIEGGEMGNLHILVTPEPKPLKKGTFDSNAEINSEGSGDMSSTQSNQI